MFRIGSGGGSKKEVVASDWIYDSAFFNLCELLLFPTLFWFYSLYCFMTSYRQYICIIFFFIPMSAYYVWKSNDLQKNIAQSAMRQTVSALSLTGPLSKIICITRLEPGHAPPQSRWNIWAFIITELPPTFLNPFPILPSKLCPILLEHFNTFTTQLTNNEIQI
jgi:hypothetical protein